MEKERQLIYNSVTCLECDEVLVSYHRHDYKTCSCPQSTMCDGGTDYGRYGGKDLTKVQTNYLYDDAPFEQIRKVIHRGGRGKNGDEPLKYVKLSEVDDEWLEAIIVYENNHRPNNKFLKYYLAEKEFRKQ
jgi:hypothetical protein